MSVLTIFIYQLQLQNQRTSTRWVFRELLGSEDVYELFPNHIRIYPPKVIVHNPTAFQIRSIPFSLLSMYCVLCASLRPFTVIMFRRMGRCASGKSSCWMTRRSVIANVIFCSCKRFANLVCAFYCFFQLFQSWKLCLYIGLCVHCLAMSLRFWKQTTWSVRSF